MKWKKRIMMLMGMTVICTSVLAGCRRATPQSVIRLAQEKSRKSQSIEGNVQVDMDMEMTNDPAVYHMSGTMSVLPPGQTQCFELYGESEKDESTGYMKLERG
ncbi:hypothetical protein NE683_08125 [Bariatricus massiliensis]|uniref:Uncharacterized protein n=1 Tax=Bariatricus massiliensis TaxID=1745713 RepID=A0ABS8DJV2_9FIRM|nr:hypothetical protein [Bariatricus massiliensis]MCB7305616.1 hypothetical protein [Bariatricus massiliensis]MCB7376170.1 hypothetical protein [Bariatricus massiliensis]MCB7388716.1 hypothetical protein [Bariatricus massiliensis]MCB7412889.1 hypothetical protein [Bariatricus massiliensis]MCQ5253195.1 hypothetical protein [Bariatricus massiliensis]